MTRPLPRLLLIGDAQQAEMRPVANVIAELIPTKQLLRRDNLSDLRGSPDAADQADVIIVCQSWPEEYTRREIGNLIAAYPLAALLCCYGSWCDSAGRNHTVWPEGVRVPVGSSSRLIRRLWERAGEGLAPPPTTASIEDVYELLHSEPLPHTTLTPAPQVGVLSGDHAIRAWLCDALSSAGYETDVEADPDALIWDAPVWSPRAVEELRSIRERHQSTPLIALIGGLRSHQSEQALTAGADRALPKITPVDELLTAVQQLLAAVPS